MMMELTNLYGSVGLIRKGGEVQTNQYLIIISELIEKTYAECFQ